MISTLLPRLLALLSALLASAALASAMLRSASASEPDWRARVSV
jgi:hypothetical protein